jgi:uncharacterized membrane protein SpoIIM required for sporulation
VIIDLNRFIERESPYWKELEALLMRLEDDPLTKLEFEEVQRFYYLYERASSALGTLETYSIHLETVTYLERLVAAAYSETRDRRRSGGFAIGDWLLRTWPQTVVRHWKSGLWAIAVMLGGAIFGALALAFDPVSKAELMPFPHLAGDPSERVARDESAQIEAGDGPNSTFAAMLMTHNTRVAIMTLALGITWGIGTIIALFYNGVILGAVALDYLAAGEVVFLLGWLLPHGVIEIPAILVAGQGGLLLASAVVGWRNQLHLAARMRCILPDLVTLIFGCGLMLIWAGVIESFLSQTHEPQIPYLGKILFGGVEAVLLVGFFYHYGVAKSRGAEKAGGGRSKVKSC